MGVLIFSINLDKPSRQYSAGEFVSGKLYIRITDVETSSEISIRFFGAAHTHWVEEEHHSHGSTSSIQYYDYTGHDSLFDYAIRLFGDGNNRYQIPVGDNVFPFTFQVPLRPLPVTCSFENGNVVYGLEARIRKPWYSVDPKTEVLPVTLWTMIDLNRTPGAANPFVVTEARSFGCCCCHSLPCILNSFTPKSGFCPGESFPFIVEFQNKSDRPIFNITATLTQVWTLSAYGIHGRHDRTHPIALQAAGRNVVRPGETTRWDMVFTVSPAVSPTPPPKSCDIVSLEYVINVNAAVGSNCCCEGSIGLSHPIIIGTIPLAVPVAVSQPQLPKYNGN